MPRCFRIAVRMTAFGALPTPEDHRLIDCCAPKPDLYAAGELRTLPVIRLRRRDQHGSTHIPSARSASSTDAFPRKVNGLLTRLAILCARKASTESPLWLHLKSRQ